MPSPFLVRTLCGVVLIICATVTLGISAHVENSVCHHPRPNVGLAITDTQARQFGVKTSTFTYDAFVGAFTIVAEVLFIGLRVGLPNSIVVSLTGEAILSALLWVFWIAAGIATTHYTSEDRSVCKHINDLFDLPEFEDVDPEVVAAAKKIFKSACSELHAELAFIWISFVLATIILGSIIWLWYRNGPNKQASQVCTYDKR